MSVLPWLCFHRLPGQRHNVLGIGLGHHVAPFGFIKILYLPIRLPVNPGEYCPVRDGE